MFSERVSPGGSRSSRRIDCLNDRICNSALTRYVSAYRSSDGATKPTQLFPFCVRRSASVRWLHFEFDSLIGVASSGPSTGSAAAELVSGVKSKNLVLAANAVIPVVTASASASGIRAEGCHWLAEDLRDHAAQAAGSK